MQIHARRRVAIALYTYTTQIYIIANVHILLSYAGGTWMEVTYHLLIWGKSGQNFELNGIFVPGFRHRLWWRSHQNAENFYYTSGFCILPTLMDYAWTRLIPTFRRLHSQCLKYEIWLTSFPELAILTSALIAWRLFWPRFNFVMIQTQYW